MKNKDNIIIGVIFLGVFMCVLSLLKIGAENTKEKQYCGDVVQVYVNAAGYKIASEKHVVFYSNELKRNVDVRVTNQQYVNTKVGQRICFNLNKMQLEE